MKARHDHSEIAKPKESAPKTGATARCTDSKTCLTPQERGKPAKSMKKLKTPPEMQLPLTMQLSPNVCTVKDWISPPRSDSSPENKGHNLSP